MIELTLMPLMMRRGKVELELESRMKKKSKNQAFTQPLYSTTGQ